jgi:hypothetical protein
MCPVRQLLRRGLPLAATATLTAAMGCAPYEQYPPQYPYSYPNQSAYGYGRDWTPSTPVEGALVGAERRLAIRHMDLLRRVT